MKALEDVPEVIMRVTIPKVQINLMKSSLVAFISGSNSNASLAEREE